MKLVLFNKPYGVHSQFRKDNDTMRTLADFFVDKSLRVAGRLDADSEGLLLLTDDGRLNHAITSPDPARQKHGKTYLVQVENIPNEVQLQALREGVVLKDGKTLPAEVRCVAQADLPIALWERIPPIRERKHIPTAWLAITIFEGKNRQVRRMTAHVGLPCLRLIRYGVAAFTVADLAVGEHIVMELDEEALARFGVRLDKFVKPSKSNKPYQFAKSKPQPKPQSKPKPYQKNQALKSKPKPNPKPKTSKLKT